MRHNPFNTVSVVGLGYIGLPTAAMLASRGVNVIGVDVNEHVVSTISQGRVHIVEPDLEGLVQKAVSSGKLTARVQPAPADAFIIAVPTPTKDDTRPDLDFVFDAARAIAPVLKRGNLIIIESTISVGTTAEVGRILSSLRPDLSIPRERGEAGDIQIAHCPERVLPGRILTEIIHNDRAIGGLTRTCTKRAADFYRTFVEGECIETDARTAELVKLTENSFRDVNVAFANELSLICEKLSINVWELISIANRHPRVNILQPGPGVGGHCIAVDPWFIVHSAPAEARLIRTAREVNDSKPEFVLRKIRDAAGNKKDVRIACLGLAFKANVDDLRHSPSLQIVEKLGRIYGDKVLAVEPFVKELPEDLRKAGVRFVDALTAIDEADIVVLLVDHRHFRMIDPSALNGKTIIDTRGLWDIRPKAAAKSRERVPA